MPVLERINDSERLLLSFRHTRGNLRTMINVPMPDQFIGELILVYFQNMGVQVKLLKETTHPLIYDVIREANTHDRTASDQGAEAA